MWKTDSLVLRCFQEDLLGWFDEHRREMPWRDTPDPYLIWVAETMLQQTRVDQVRPYFERFIQRFPDVHTLAHASIDDVLKAWEGLGYYRRAHHLHRAARIIVTRHDGQIPTDPKALSALPGVGPYTCAAVLSIAYQYPMAAIDGNVIRVLTRVFGLAEDVSRQATRRKLQELAQSLLPPYRPGDFNQALMELGATVCTPTRPQCEACPLHPVCTARMEGNPVAYPVKQKRAPIPHIQVAVGILLDTENRVLVTRRPNEAMLGGLWEFPGGKIEAGESPEEACRRELREELCIDVAVRAYLGTVTHTYSHFRVTLYAFLCEHLSGTPHTADGRPMQWIALSEIHTLAFPRASQKVIELLTATAPTHVPNAKPLPS